MSSKIVLALLVLAFASQALALRLTINIGSSAMYCRFSVKLDKPLKSFEKVGVSGNTHFFGNWSTDAVVFLEKTYTENLWSGKVQCETNTTVNYRYFVGIEAENGDLQIREWETHVEGRTIYMGTEDVDILDEFGVVDGVKGVHRGWLNSGYILHLKLFNNPIKLNDIEGAQKFFVKVTPLDLNTTNNIPIPPSPRVYVESTRMEYGDSEFKAQPEEGLLYEEDDLAMFQITTTDMESIVYDVTIYKEGDGGEKVLLAFTYLYPEDLRANDGNLDAELFSPLDDDSVIGMMKIGFLWIKPLEKRNPPLDFRTTFAYYWPKESPTLDAGHRGIGKSIGLGLGAAPFIEGTIASMVASGEHGTDMIEYDVINTKDNYLVIYHAFEIHVAKNPSVKPTSADDITTKLIMDMTYEELKNARMYEMVGLDVKEYRTHNEETRENWRLFPTFEDVLLKVPHYIGMDIEIKWPLRNANGDKHLFVNKILDVMLRLGCGRLSFFTSEDADILAMIRYKQNMFGAMTLGLMSGDELADQRTISYERLLNTAKTLDLMGAVPHAVYFSKNAEENVKKAKDQNLKVCIWGDEISTSVATLNDFSSMDLECAICDRPDKLLPKGKKSIFSKGEFPEYFEKQCPIIPKN